MKSKTTKFHPTVTDAEVDGKYERIRWFVSEKYLKIYMCMGISLFHCIVVFGTTDIVSNSWAYLVD